MARKVTEKNKQRRTKEAKKERVDENGEVKAKQGGGGSMKFRKVTM